MPVPTVITDLSTTAASNSPAGSEPPGPDGDNHIRALAAFIAQLHAGSTSVAAGILKSNGSAISVGTADTDYQSALTAASQAEMEAGTETAVRKMSPLRVAQAIASTLNAASQAEMEAGTETAIRKMSPLRVAQAVVALGLNKTVGYAQSWASAGYSINTVYTNSTSRPITVSAAITVVGGSTAILTINGIPVYGSTVTSAGATWVMGVVPPGHTFQFTSVNGTAISTSQVLS